MEFIKKHAKGQAPVWVRAQLVIFICLLVGSLINAFLLQSRSTAYYFIEQVLLIILARPLGILVYWLTAGHFEIKRPWKALVIWYIGAVFMTFPFMLLAHYAKETNWLVFIAFILSVSGSLCITCINTITANK